MADAVHSDAGAVSAGHACINS